MARPQKQGLSYFPIDVDIFEDEKLQFISAKYGLKGEAIVFRLLSKIYRNGYYIEFDEDVQLLFSKSCGLERNDNATRNVVSELLKRNFFDKSMFEQFQVLTSKGIQKRYAKICNDSRRIASNLLPKYDLTQEETEFPYEETPVSYGGNYTKKSKVNESKVNKSKEVKSQNLENNDLPTFVSENRKNVAPAVGPRPKLTKEFLKQDFLNNRDIEKLYENNNIADNYEKVIDSFIYEAFAVGKNENWKNIQNARWHLINSFKYYNNKYGINNNFQKSQSTGNFERPNLFGKEGKSANRLVAIGQRPSISDIRQKTTFEISE
jgi:hypothetical protein